MRRAVVLAVLALVAAVAGWSCSGSESEREAGETPVSEPGTAAAAPASGAGKTTGPAAAPAEASPRKDGKMTLSEAEWKNRLTPEQYYVLRQKGTERAFTGEYWNMKKDGTYVCAACGNELFSSETKFDSGTGWPSYWAPISADNVKTEQDRSLFMTRTEVLCNRCDSHLGHVFPDGPAPTHQRYCINSVSLDFKEREAGKGAASTEESGAGKVE